VIRWRLIESPWIKTTGVSVVRLRQQIRQRDFRRVRRRTDDYWLWRRRRRWWWRRTREERRPGRQNNQSAISAQHCLQYFDDLLLSVEQGFALRFPGRFGH
jgi:hypothetical protein